jgi:hypothetical protein
VGVIDGASVGVTVGTCDGVRLGSVVGTTVTVEGISDGYSVSKYRRSVGCSVGALLSIDGTVVGVHVGPSLGCKDGVTLGIADGLNVGKPVDGV